MATIAYTDKDNSFSSPDARGLVRDVDLNEIKSVVNANAAHLALTNNPHSVTASQVGLGSANNTADSAKPVSTAQQTALDLKQATLVSGTNIKTVNGGTLLGSGDLTIVVTTFAENIIPTGTVNGSNPDFVLPSTPVASSLKLYSDGVRMIGGGVDYTLSGTNITMVIAPVSAIIADYRI